MKMINIKDTFIKTKNMCKNTLKTIGIMWNDSKLYFIMTLVTNIFSGLIVSLNMITSKYLIDSVISSLSNRSNQLIQNKVFIWLFVEFVITTFSYFINRLNTYFSQIQVKSLNNYISRLIIEKVNELDFSYFENSEFYNKIEKANNQSVASIIGVTSSITDIVKNCSVLIGSIMIVIKLNPLIVLLCIGTSIPMFFINIKISKIKYDIYEKRLEKTRFAAHLQKIMLHYNNVKEIKLNRIGKYIEKIILSIYNTNLSQDKVVGKKQLMSLSLVDCFSTIISYCYKIYVIFVTISKRLTIGSMNMYMSALTNVNDSIRNTLNSIVLLYSNNLYIENLFSALELKAIVANDKDLKNFNNNIMDSIEFRNVSFKYPNSEKYILKNISFKIKANETCAIVGLNGSGKTTLVKLLTRLQEPTEGEICIDGINIKKFSIESLYKHINVVFQDFMKYPFTVKHNIGFGDIDNVNNMNLIELAARKANAYSFIQELDNKFNTKLEKLWTNGVELSLGQWQKLAISRAFMSNSAILILDEPTASIDAQAEYELFKNFKELAGKSTSILISHKFSTVKMADIIVVLKDGEIIESGKHNELMKNNKLYYKLYTMQAKAYMNR